MPVCGGTFKLEEATIDQMQKAMQDGIMTSQQLVICYMQRTFQTQEYIRLDHFLSSHPQTGTRRKPEY